MEQLIKMQVALNMSTAFNLTKHAAIIEYCGGIEGFFMESEKALQKVFKEFNLNPESVDRKKMLKEAETELPNIEKHDIRVCTFEAHDYPPLLKECPDTPLVFYYKGKLTPEPAVYFAVVGTRRASERCRHKTDTIIRQLAHCKEKLIIVSGLAFGIDHSAHQAAIKSDITTYAVLGHGLHMIYPSSHKNIAHKIMEEGGCLISEVPCSTPAHPVFFLKRNRIIAGMSHAVLISESAEKGGAMSTARMAHSYEREVLAIPGRPEDSMSAGCNRLIKENIACLCENEADVANIIGLSSCQKESQSRLLFEDSHNDTILRFISEKGCINIDELSHASELPVHQLSVILMQLELDEKIISLPGNVYALKT